MRSGPPLAKYSSSKIICNTWPEPPITRRVFGEKAELGGSRAKTRRSKDAETWKLGLEVVTVTENEIAKEVDGGFRADLVVEDKVLVELKSLERTAPVHKKQTLTYIRLADLRLGLLINFGAALIKDGITRVVNGLRDEPA